MLALMALLVSSLPLEHFALLAEQTLEIDAGAVCVGEVGARQRLKSAGESADLHAPHVTLERSAEARRVYASQFSAARGARYNARLAFDGLPLSPGVSAQAAGTQDVEVSFLRTRRLQPGAYQGLEVRAGATIELQAGDYVFTRVSLGIGARLRGLGTVRVHVLGDVEGSLLNVWVGSAGASTLTITAVKNVSLGLGSSARMRVHAAEGSFVCRCCHRCVVRPLHDASRSTPGRA